MFGILRIPSNNSDDGSDSKIILPFSTPLSIKSKVVSSVSDTMGLRRKTFRYNAHRWELSVTIKVFDSNVEGLLILLVRGHDTPFLVRPPLPFRHRSTAIGKDSSGLVYPNSTSTLQNLFSGSRGNYLQSNVSKGLTGINLNVAGVAVFLGDFVRFDSHNKLYMIVSLTLSVSNTVAIIQLYPPLRADITASTFVYLGTHATMTCIMDTDSPVAISYTDGIVPDLGTISMLEVL